MKYNLHIQCFRNLSYSSHQVTGCHYTNISFISVPSFLKQRKQASEMSILSVSVSPFPAFVTSSEIAPSYSYFSTIGNSNMADAQTCEMTVPLALPNIDS
jgi:hypothetical protein